MAEKQNPKERLKEITDSIETGIKELFESDKYKSYLQTMSRFHKYSFNNTMLISMQKPDATLVAGFNKWRDGFSRFVKKGEKSIKIIAPTPYKIKEEREKLDPQTKAPILDANGKVQTEEVEVQIPMFRVVSVFDVSQTEGEPLPTLANNLTGNVEQFDVFMEAIKRTAPVPIEIMPLSEDTDGYYHTEEKRIAIRDDMSEVQTVSAAIHEVAHSLLHNREMEKELQAQQDENAKPIKPKSRNTEEVEAESISFAVCSYYGIQTAENSLGYIASWSKGKELAELRASLETINKTSSELITNIDTHFAEIIKERDLDLVAEVPVPEKVQHLAYQVGELYFSIQEIEDGYDYSIYDKDFNLLDGGVYDATDVTIHEAIDQIVCDVSINELSALTDRKNALLVDYDELTANADQAWRDGMNKMKQSLIPEKSYNIEVEGHIGTWSVIDTTEINDTPYFLLEHEDHSDEAACVIVDRDGKLVLDDVWNGFDDLNEHFDSIAAEEQRIDEPIQHDYPMPDPTVSIDDRNAYGYTTEELLPLSKERAVELWEQDLTVYLLYEDNTEAMAFDREDIDNHDGLFGIEAAEWQKFHNLDKNNSFQEPQKTETEFLEQSQNTYSIYQLKNGEDLRDYRFEGTTQLNSFELSVERDNYEIVYIAPLTDYDGDKNHTLNKLYEQFNLNHPSDFKGHSLSVSDIVVLNVDGAVSCHYVDSFGFKELPQFLEPAPLVPDNFITGEKIETPRGSFSLTSMTKEQMEQAGYGYHHSSDNGAYLIMGNGTRAFAIRNEDNPLRTAELSTEQNFNQIDGIINNQPTVAELEKQSQIGTPIALMDLLYATRREEKQSVMEQLKTKPPQTQEKSKKAPSVGAEMEL